MRDYGTVDTGIWKHHQFKPLCDSAKLLASYARTNDHGNMIGCYHLPIEYIAGDLRWDHGKVQEMIAELLPNGFLKYCETTEYVFLPKHLIKLPLKNENMAKGAAALFEEIPAAFTYLTELHEILTSQPKMTKQLVNRLDNRLQTVREIYATQELELELEQDKDCQAPSDPPHINADFSVAGATAMHGQAEPKDFIWQYGVHALTETGMQDKRARSFLGGLCKTYGDPVVADAVLAAYTEKAMAPEEFIVAACQFKSGKRVTAKLSAVDRVRMANMTGDNDFVEAAG